MRGDTDDFTTAYLGVSEELYRFAYYMLGHREDAEDAVGDAVLAAFEEYPKLRDRSAFRAWIMKILANTCRRKRGFYANRRTESLDEMLESGSEPISGEELEPEERVLLRESLKGLSDEEREIVILISMFGYKAEEVAKMLELNPATVRSKKSRALAKLASAMSQGTSQAANG